MPRAGSTLLQNLLSQHPEIYATPTDGAVGFVENCKHVITHNPEFLAQPKEQNIKSYKGFIQKGLEGYYESLTDKKYVVSKSRGWLNTYGTIADIYEDVKVICMVRDLRDIVASLEKRYRNTPYDAKQFVNFAEMKFTTYEKRIEFYLTNAPLVFTLDVLKDFIIRPESENVLFIKYEQLLNSPEKVMDAIYKYLGIKKCKHDFNKIKQSTFENDTIHGIFGDHKIREKLEPPKENAYDILGEHACNFIYNQHRWFFEYFNYDF